MNAANVLRYSPIGSLAKLVKTAMPEPLAVGVLGGLTTDSVGAIIPLVLSTPRQVSTVSYL